MRGNNVLGIVFANANDDLIPELTRKRSVASIPFGSRYRVIDFSLSNLTNAGIRKVGVITKENYRSLMDHLGSGRSWDLDRKYGGLTVLPPFSSNSSNNEVFKGKIDALANVMSYLESSSEEYIVLCDADVVSNIDISDFFDSHISSGADFTVAYKNLKVDYQIEGNSYLTVDAQSGRVKDVYFYPKNENENISLDIMVTKREFLIKKIKEANARGEIDFAKHFVVPNLDKYIFNGYEVKAFASILNSTKQYFDLSMKLLKSSVRKELFYIGRPVYTKMKDDMPTKYGISCKVENSLIADGCVIKGSVKNCIIFRGVTVEEGAEIENSIVMQYSNIGKNAKLKYVIMEKNSEVSDGKIINASADRISFVEKGEKV